MTATLLLPGDYRTVARLGSHSQRRLPRIEKRKLLMWNVDRVSERAKRIIRIEQPVKLPGQAGSNDHVGFARQDILRLAQRDCLGGPRLCRNNCSAQTGD